MTDSGSMTNPSEAIIEAVARALAREDCEPLTMSEISIGLHVDKRWREKIDAARAAIVIVQQAAIPAAPVQQDWEVGDPRANAAWDEIMQDERLKRARSQLSLHEIRLMIGHVQRAYLPPAAPVQDDDPMVRDVEEWLRTHPPDRAEVRQRAFQDASMPEDRVAPLVEALTPSAETKAAYIGEFEFDYRSYYGNESVMVPWTTIKEIMAAILKRARERTPDA